MTSSDRSGLPADLDALVLDVRHFTAWHGAQFGYWDDSGPHNIKTPEVPGEPDEFGPLARTAVCALVLQGGAVALGHCAPDLLDAGHFADQANRSTALRGVRAPPAVRWAALQSAIAQARTLLQKVPTPC